MGLAVLLSTGLPHTDGAIGIADRTAAASALLHEVSQGVGWGEVRWKVPEASAAFSRRDACTPGFSEAVAAVEERGFEPFIRPVGGRLAAYHQGALVLDILVRCADPRPGTTERFRLVSRALSRGLQRLGVPAGVGEVPHEYCPGRWSVHAEGRRKLIGTGQRVTRGAVLVTAVIVIADPGPLADVMSAAYGPLGLEVDPSTVGAVTQSVPSATHQDVQDALAAALAEVLPLGAADASGTRSILDSWDPR